MFKSARVTVVPFVVVVVVLLGSASAFAQTASSTDTTPWLMEELVFSRFICDPDDVVEMSFEGTSGVASNRFTIQRWDVSTSICSDIANALVEKGQTLGCVASPVRSSSWSTSVHIMCHGDRGDVISAIAGLSTEMLTFPATAGASSRSIVNK